MVLNIDIMTPLGVVLEICGGILGYHSSWGWCLMGGAETLATLSSLGQLYKPRISFIYCNIQPLASLLVIHIGENLLYNYLSQECNSILHIDTKFDFFSFQSFNITWIFQKYHCNVYWRRIVYCLSFNFTRTWFPLLSCIMPSVGTPAAYSR